MTSKAWTGVWLCAIGMLSAQGVAVRAAGEEDADRVLFNASKVWRCSIVKEHACGVDGAYACVERLAGKPGGEVTLRRDRGTAQRLPTPSLQICMNLQCASWVDLGIEYVRYSERWGDHWIWLWGMESPHLTARIIYNPLALIDPLAKTDKPLASPWILTLATDGPPFAGRDMTILSGPCEPVK